MQEITSVVLYGRDIGVALAEAIGPCPQLWACNRYHVIRNVVQHCYQLFTYLIQELVRVRERFREDL